MELEVTLPGEGRDRVFKVAIRWVSQVNLFDLERALEGVSRQIPMEAIQALDVVCLLYTSPSPRDQLSSRMPSSA